MDGSIGEDWTMSLNLVPLAMKALLGKGPALRVFGTDYPTPDGTAIRDYIHVDDLADAHLKAIDYLAAGGATTAVNLGTGTGSSVREVLAAAELLGWKARYGLDDIVTSAWNWHSLTADA